MGKTVDEFTEELKDKFRVQVARSLDVDSNLLELVEMKAGSVIITVRICGVSTEDADRIKESANTKQAGGESLIDPVDFGISQVLSVEASEVLGFEVEDVAVGKTAPPKETEPVASPKISPIPAAKAEEDVPTPEQEISPIPAAKAEEDVPTPQQEISPVPAAKDEEDVPTPQQEISPVPAAK